MNYIIETVGLAVTGFIIFIVTTIYHLVATTITPTFYNLYNESGIGGVANPILGSIVLFGYAACGVFFAGAIILYLVKAHEEEHEQYQTYENRYGRY